VATVFLPSEVAHRAGAESIVIDAPRVHELMHMLAARFPELAEILPRMAVAVDGEIYNDADYIEIGAATEIHLVPRISGGAR
jgi:molybdopterin converting factor small subunit